jgi:hypothetical protein
LVVIVFSVLLQSKVSDYPFGFFNIFLTPLILNTGATSGAGTAYPSGAPSEFVYRRTDKTMVKRKRTNNDPQNIHIKLNIE